MEWHDRFHGVLAVNKPRGITSHDVVFRVRKILQQQAIGHTGTLDPLAEGLMVLCLGRATKIVQFLSDYNKTYEAEIMLGVRSTTFDAEGVVPEAVPSPLPEISGSGLEAVVASFVGKIEQTVPVHSSTRVGGKHLYQLARKGREVSAPSKTVEINSIHLLSVELPLIRIEVMCGKGTYIRSLANDIGERLGCGAYLANLKRTAVGAFRLETALDLGQISSAIGDGSLEHHIILLEQVLAFGALRLKEGSEQVVIHGQTPDWCDIESVEGAFRPGDNIMVKDPRGQALAVVIAGIGSDGMAEHIGKPVAGFVRVLG